MKPFMSPNMTIDPNVCGGRPALRGTRFLITQLLAELAEGKDWRGIARDFELEESVVKGFLLDLARYFREGFGK